MNPLVKHLDEALSKAIKFQQPYPVWYYKPFPDDFYQEVLANLPDTGVYVHNFHLDSNRDDGTNPRMSFTLRPDRLALLPAHQKTFWTEVNRQLRSDELKEVVRKHMGVTGHAFATLIRDTVGYKIGVHPDWDMKVITMQFYLPEDCSQEHLGTDIYDANKNHVRRLPFIPNSGYAFVRSDTSFHAVEPLPLTVRNSLYLTFNREPWNEY